MLKGIFDFAPEVVLTCPYENNGFENYIRLRDFPRAKKSEETSLR